MFKAHKADDEQWIDWIQRADLNKEKAWAKRFFFCAAACFLISIIGSTLERIELIVASVGTLVFTLMGVAKLNNYRLYRIIQNLSNASKVDISKPEPDGTDNA